MGAIILLKTTPTTSTLDENHPYYDKLLELHRIVVHAYDYLTAYNFASSQDLSSDNDYTKKLAEFIVISKLKELKEMD